VQSATARNSCCGGRGRRRCHCPTACRLDRGRGRWQIQRHGAARHDLSRAAGIDSFTDVFNAPGFAIYTDYGAHTARLERDRDKTAYVERTLNVDGKPGKLVTGRTRAGVRSYFIGMHVDVRRSVVGMTGLTLTCNLEREQDMAIVEPVYSSVRFK